MDQYIDAYILRTIDYQEHSKLVYFYTPNGQSSAIARGVKKMDHPLRHLVQPGTLASFSFSKGKLPTVKDAEKRFYYPTIKSDLVKTTVLSTVNDLIYYNVTDTDDNAKLFGFLKKFIHQLSITEHPLELLMVFEMKLLAFLGYLVNFKHCYQCQETEVLKMEIGSGLIACSKHQDPQRDYISYDTYAPLKYYLHCDILSFTSLSLENETLKQLYRIIDELYTTNLQFSSKAKKLLTTLL